MKTAARTPYAILKKSEENSKLFSHSQALSKQFKDSNTLLAFPETYWNQNQGLTLKEYARTVIQFA